MNSPACVIRLQRRSGGFTLLELLSVMAVITLCSVMTIPALSGALKGTSLNNSVRTTMNLLAVARTEAITRRQLVRFAVATDWPDNSSASYRKVSLWASPTGDPDSWQQINRWEELPIGISFYADAAEHIATDARPTADPVFGKTPGPTFATLVGTKEVKMEFVEFTPGGAIRANSSQGFKVWFALADGYKTSQPPSNWAVLSANIHTGRFRCTRPGS